MTQKKSSDTPIVNLATLALLSITCVILGLLPSIEASYAETAASPSTLPVLRYAGVIPVQWAKSDVWQDLDHIKKGIDQDFTTAIRDSKRFSVLNDELVKSLWKSPAGRKELESDYELSVFANLDVASRGDMVIFTSRLLSPKLETRLQESDVISRQWLSESTRDQTAARLADLVHRLINRLPVDAHITSVNGQFVTLSGGTEQGVKIGDKFDVLSASIQNIHPANGSWISFATSKTGTIEVVEIKNISSIAKITSLSFDGAIKPNQGIRIEDISGRSKFSRLEEVSALPSAQKSPESAIAAPLGPDGKPATQADDQPKPKVAEPTPEVKSVAPKPQEEVPQALPQAPANPAPTPATPEEKTEKAPEDSAPQTDAFTAFLIPKGSEIRTWLGLKMWSIAGSSSAYSALPVWIVNGAGADIYRRFSDTIDFSYGLDIGYGPTGKGNFFGYNIHSAGRWHLLQKDLLPGVDDFFSGLQVSMASASITGETTGGFDLTQIRLNLGVHGWAKPGFIGEKIEWTGEIFYPLYYSGRFGVKAAFKNIESGSSMAFRIGGYLGDRPASGWQYGAGFDYESSSWSLQNKKSAAYDSIGLLMLARRSL